VVKTLFDRRRFVGGEQFEMRLKSLLLFWPERCIIETDVFLPAWIGCPSDQNKRPAHLLAFKEEK
jgi:hypothetical protein